ncbi:MAG: hypothetical protein HY658_07270 [Actinobacteria bacterium]|nr:hypothetical protein [Actinomycetota bacterium]
MSATVASRSRSPIRRRGERPAGGVARVARAARVTRVARVDRRTKNLLRRIQPGEIAVIDHEDLDRVSAEALVTAGAYAVVNARRSITGRYPNLGPLILVQAGVPLLDEVGQLLLSKLSEGDLVRVDGDRIYVGDALVGVGTLLDDEAVMAEMDAAQRSLADRFERFAENTLEFMQRERDLLFGGVGLPDLAHDLSGRAVLVVVRGYHYREDLAALRPYIRDLRPVLIGVDGGADALLEAGYRPDLIVGDMDSVSERALALALFPRSRRRAPTEVVLHAYPGGHAPGRERLEQLGVPHTVVEASGTSEDLAFIMAHEKGAELIVAVGTHGNLREFLDKGRMGMSSTFLVRLRVGEILMDAKGVSRLYQGRPRAREVLLVIGSALFAMLVIAIVSQPVRLFLRQLVELFRQFLFQLRELV